MENTCNSSACQTQRDNLSLQLEEARETIAALQISLNDLRKRIESPSIEQGDLTLEMERQAFMQNYVAQMFHSDGSAAEQSDRYMLFLAPIVPPFNITAFRRFKAIETFSNEPHRFDRACHSADGRHAFARELNNMRGMRRCCSDRLYKRLAASVTTVLRKCGEELDFTPAKTLMNMAYTFYRNTESGVFLPRSAVGQPETP